MRRAFDDHQFRSRRNRGQRRAHFLDRSKWIARPVSKKRGRSQLIKVFRAKLPRLVRRMQRIRQQQQPVGERRILRRGHARLTPAIRVPAREYAARRQFTKRAYGLADAFAIARRLRRKRRTMRARPPIGQIESQRQVSCGRELRGDRSKQRRFAIGSRAMCDREGVA